MWYKTDELVASTVFVRNFWKYLSKIRKKELNKIAILKNNKVEWILLSPELYKEIEDIIEHLEIYNIVKKRNKKEDFIDGKQFLKKFNVII